MFSRKKKAPVQKSGTRHRPPVDFGIPGIPGFDPSIQEDDADLEAELLALTGGRRQTADDTEFAFGGNDDDDLEAELSRIIGSSSKKKSPKTNQHGPSRENPASVVDPIHDVDDAANSDDDIDENDPELLGELQMLTCEDEEGGGDEGEYNEGVEMKKEGEEYIPSQREMLKSRLDAYRAAERNAKASNESARARRFNRGVKTLEKLLRRAEEGEVVPPDEIPPEIGRPGPTAAKEPIASHLAAPPATFPQLLNEAVERSHEEQENVQERQGGPKKQRNEAIPLNEPVSLEEELVTSRSEDTNPISVREEASIVILEPEQQVLPVRTAPHPPLPARTSSLGIMEKLKTRRDQYKKSALAAKNEGNKLAALDFVRTVKKIESFMAEVEDGQTLLEDQIPPPPFTEKPVTSLPRKPAPLTSVQASSLMSAEIFTVPKTVSEALNQRLNYYTKVSKKAEMSGLRVEAKKCADIVRLYQNAIRLHQRGSNVPFEKLPTPPGCPPIPLVFKI